MEELLTAKEAAQALRVSVHTIRAWTFYRKIPFIRLGRKVLFRTSDLEKFIAKGLHQAKP